MRMIDVIKSGTPYSILFLLLSLRVMISRRVYIMVGLKI